MIVFRAIRHQGHQVASTVLLSRLIFYWQLRRSKDVAIDILK